MIPHDDLKAFLDGELPAERMAELRETIERDPAMAAEAEEMTRISNTIRAAAAQPSAVGLEETLRLLERAERPPVWRRWVAPLCVATAAIAVIVITPKMLSSSGAMSEVAMESKAKDVATAARIAETPSTMEAPADAMKRDAFAANPTVNGAAKAGIPGSQVIKTRTKSGNAFRSPSSPVRTRSQPSPSPDLGRNVGGTNRVPAGGVTPLSSSPPVSVAVPVRKEEQGEKRDLAAESQTLSDATVLNVKSKGGQDDVVVVEVDSPEDAEAAIRDLAFRMGGEVNPPEPVPSGAVAKSRAVVGQLDAKVVEPKVTADAAKERRLVLEVDEDRVEEARKKIPDVVREERTRRLANDARDQNPNLRGGSPGAPGSSQSAGQFPNPRGAGGDGLANRGGFGGGGRGFGGGGPGGVQRGGAGGGGFGASARNSEGDNRRNVGNRNVTENLNLVKVRKRLQIVLKIRPKPTGKLDE